MNLKNKIILIYLFNYILAPIAYLIRIIYSHSLSLEEIGLLFAIIGFFGIFFTFNDLGFTETLNYHGVRFFEKKEYGKLKASFVYTMLMQISSSILLLVIFYFIAPWLAETYFLSSTAVELIRILVAYYFISGLILSYYSLFHVTGDYHLFSFSELIRQSSILIITFLGVIVFHKGLIFAGWVYVISSGITYLFCMLYIHIKYYYIFKSKAKYSYALFKKLFKYALPILLGSGAILLLTKIDIAIITMFRSLSEVALYSYAFAVSQLLFFAVSPIGSTFFPLASKSKAKKDMTGIKNLGTLLYTKGVVISLPILLLIVCFPKELLTFFFGEVYANAYLILIILAIANYINFLSTYPLGVLAGLGKIKLRTILYLIALLINIVFSVVTIMYLGSIGVAIGLLIAMSMLFLSSLIYVNKIVNLDLKAVGSIYYIKMILANTCVVGLVYLLKSILKLNYIFEGIIIFTIVFLVYLSLVIFMDLITWNDLRKVIKSE